MKLKKTALALILSISLLVPNMMSINADAGQKDVNANLVGEELDETQQISLNYDSER